MVRRRLLTHDQARRFYDRFGARQDSQLFYEGPALADLLPRLDLAACRAVIEYGCGTGRLAAELLARWLPADAAYLGLDVSGTMIALAEARLRSYGPRARQRRVDGAPRIDSPDGACDRFICCYVLDLLAEDEIRALLHEAHRLLAPGGLLGLVAFTYGTGAVSRLVSGLWSGVHLLSPALVGGCRPVALAGFVAPPEWQTLHRGVVTPFGIPSEIVVARSVARGGA